MSPLHAIAPAEFEAAKKHFALHQPFCASRSPEGTCERIRGGRVACRMGNCSWLGTHIQRYAREHGEG